MTSGNVAGVSFVGMLEQFIPPRGLTGWVAKEVSAFNDPINLVILLDGHEVGRVTSDALRERQDAPGEIARGFGTHVSIDITYGHLSRNAIEVCPICEDGSFGQALPYHPLLAMLGRVGDGLLALSELRNASDHVFTLAFDRLYSSSVLGYAERSPLTLMRTLRGARHLYHRLIHNERLLGNDCDLTPILVPVGMKSGDGSALLGRNGFVFLIGGRNSFMDSYSAEHNAPAVIELAARWYQLFKARQARLEAAGARYLQLIIPEKLSVLPDMYPNEIGVPTRLLMEVEDRISGDRDLSSIYVSGAAFFSRHIERLNVYLKVDSHLTPFGTWLLYSEIMQRLGYDPGTQPKFNQNKATFGDMSERFFSLNFLDCRAEADPETLDPFHDVATKTYEKISPTGHVGTAESWSNPDAPISASLLVFGNSFTGPAGKAQNSLSFWLSRMFTQYHFVWSSEITDGLIEKLRPDIVIGQTIERFLSEIPSS